MNGVSILSVIGSIVAILPYLAIALLVGGALWIVTRSAREKAELLDNPVDMSPTSKQALIVGLALVSVVLIVATVLGA